MSTNGLLQTSSKLTFKFTVDRQSTGTPPACEFNSTDRLASRWLQAVGRTVRLLACVPVYCTLVTSALLSGDQVVAEAKEGPIKGLLLKVPMIPASVTGELRSLNETLSQDVTPFENAVVLLTQLFGDVMFDAPLRDASLEMLGIETLSTTAPQIQYVESFVKFRGVTDPEEIGRQTHLLEKQIFKGADHPWTPEELPDLDAFLAVNQAALDLFREAAGKKRYFAPVLSVEDPPRILSASLTLERRLPFVAQVLCARALQRLADQDGLEGIDDLLTCHKLAGLLASGSPFDVSGVKAHLMDAMACHAAHAALVRQRMNGNQANYYLAQLNKIPHLPASWHASDRGERAILHQEIEFLKSDDSFVRDFFNFPKEKSFEALDKIRLSELPWDHADERADQVHSRFVKALSNPNRIERTKEFEILDKEYLDWTDHADEKNSAVAEAVQKDLTEITRWIGETMAMSLRPWYWQRIAMDERARMRRDLVTIGMALVAYRSEHESFPTDLSELVPKYLDDVPNDAHTDQPFDYVRMGKDQARVATLGGNHLEDAGKPFNDDRSLELKWDLSNHRPPKNGLH